MAAETVTPEPETAQQPIPSYLIYETLNGKPLYRKGYKDVLANRKNPAEVIGSFDFESIVVSALYCRLAELADRQNYWVVTNRPRVLTSTGSYLSNDIAFYLKQDVTIKGKFFDVAPKVVVEVNVKIDFEVLSATAMDYVYEKTQAMLDFGTERVIWITTQSRKVLVATRGESWLTLNWDATIPVLGDVTLNIADVLTEEGVI